MESRKWLYTRESLVNFGYVICECITEIKKSSGFILLVRQYLHSEAPDVTLSS